MDENLQEIILKIQACVKDKLEFIALFGSRVRDESHPLSDIDLGVKTSTLKGAQRQLQLELAGLSNYDSQPQIDIVLLDVAPLTLQYRVVRDGRVLYQRDQEVWPKFVEHVLSRYPDWKIFLDGYLTESVGV